MKNSIIFLICIAFLTGCDGVFDYHPYDARFGGDKGINSSAIERIAASCAGKDTLVVAFVSDSHQSYSHVRDLIYDLNRHDSIDFVVHLGDLTDTGTTKEFVWTRDAFSELKYPYVALIGNHDFMGTGCDVYRSMFGEMDFSFVAGCTRFVCLNTCALEYNHIAPVPDFDFIERNCLDSHDGVASTIVCMHAAPFSDQFNNNVAKTFGYYVGLMPDLLFCIHGHDHSLSVADIFDNDASFYCVDSVEHRNYLIFTITRQNYSYEIIYF